MNHNKTNYNSYMRTNLAGQNNGARKTSDLHQNLIRLNNSYEDRRNLAVLPHKKYNEYEKRSDNEITVIRQLF